MLPENFRLLQIMAGAEQGGAERFFTRLVTAFARRNINQRVIIRPFAETVNIMEKNQVPVVPASFRRWFDFSTAKIIKKTIQEYRPTVVMTWMSRASHIVPRSDAVLVARLGGYYDLKYYQKADYLVGNTQDIVDYFHQSGWPKSRTAWLPNFPDLPEPAPPLSRRLLDTPVDAPLILSLGRFHDDKAFDILIPALALVPGAFLWLGGDGSERSKLEKLARTHGVWDRIRFIGWRSDVSALYKACDVYTCPSRVEPLGNVILEAWAHNKPVVAAKSDGPRGLIRNGENGLLVEMNNVNELAAALQRVVDDKNLASALAIGGYNTFIEYFTEEAVVNAWFNFFDQITDHNNRSPKKCVV